NRANGRVVTKPSSDGMREVIGELIEPNATENVTAVVKNDAPETVVDGQRKAEFRINDKEHLAADRHADQRAGGLIGGIAANGQRSLRSGAIDWESAKRVRAAREKSLADRHV